MTLTPVRIIGATRDRDRHNSLRQKAVQVDGPQATRGRLRGHGTESFALKGSEEFGKAACSQCCKTGYGLVRFTSFVCHLNTFLALSKLSITCTISYA